MTATDRCFSGAATRTVDEIHCRQCSWPKLCLSQCIFSLTFQLFSLALFSFIPFALRHEHHNHHQSTNQSGESNRSRIAADACINANFLFSRRFRLGTVFHFQFENGLRNNPMHALWISTRAETNFVSLLFQINHAMCSSARMTTTNIVLYSPNCRRPTGSCRSQCLA